MRVGRLSPWDSLLMRNLLSKMLALLMLFETFSTNFSISARKASVPSCGTRRPGRLTFTTVSSSDFLSLLASALSARLRLGLSSLISCCKLAHFRNYYDIRWKQWDIKCCEFHFATYIHFVSLVIASSAATFVLYDDCCSNHDIETFTAADIVESDNIIFTYTVSVVWMIQDSAMGVFAVTKFSLTLFIWFIKGIWKFLYLYWLMFLIVDWFFLNKK